MKSTKGKRLDVKDQGIKVIKQKISNTNKMVKLIRREDQHVRLI